MITITRKKSLALALTMLATCWTSAEAAVATSGCALADTCTLAELLGGGSITAGNVVFSAFDDSLAVDEPGDKTKVTVTGLDDMGLDPGPGFRLQTNDEIATSAGAAFLYRFDFLVSTGDASSTISGLSLAGSPALKLGTADEWVVSASAPSDSMTTDPVILESTLFPLDTDLDDDLDLTMLASSLTVRHVISLESGFGTGITLDDYTFRVALVPLPGALWLLLSGLPLLGAMARRARA